jgi:cob(I)alamin adenosyltransferase
VVRIYTRTGDGGESALFGGGRVRKDDPRLAAYGTLDELNALLGWFRSRNTEADLDDAARGAQEMLFALGAHLATPADARARAALPALAPRDVEALESVIDRLEHELPPLAAFLLPGGTENAALLHLARTVCRRAERAVVAVHAAHGIDPVILPYLNRLSDLLFVMARAANRRAGRTESTWTGGRPEP